jgi:putative hemolysin
MNALDTLKARRIKMLTLLPTPPPAAVRSFGPHVSLYIESSRYVVKTVDSITELHQALLLRGKIFSEEYSGIRTNPHPLDVDTYDFHCEHLVILEKQSQQVVGTYRLLCSKFTEQFYSESEFELTEFLKTPGIKLELGRACIAREHRRGAVLNLLWRGIMSYARIVNAEYLFGCSSVHTESPWAANQLIERLKGNQAYQEKWGIEPRPEFRLLHLFETNLDPQHADEIEIPSLFQSYLNAGAVVVGAPAHDRDFHCIDFFTLLKLSDLHEAFEKRYQN